MSLWPRRAAATRAVAPHCDVEGPHVTAPCRTIAPLPASTPPAPPPTTARDGSTTPRRIIAIATFPFPPVAPGAARRAATHGRGTHAVLGLQVGAPVHQQLHHVLVATPRCRNKSRCTTLRGLVPSTTTIHTARDRRNFTPVTDRQPASLATAFVALALDGPHAGPRSPWRSSPTGERKAPLWLYHDPCPRQ